jgi:hypothetical protein
MGEGTTSFAGSSFQHGSSIQKRLPLPGSDSTPARPPMRSAPFSDYCQSTTSSRISFRIMQAMEESENPFMMFGSNANPVIFDPNPHESCDCGRGTFFDTSARDALQTTIRLLRHLVSYHDRRKSKGI